MNRPFHRIAAFITVAAFSWTQIAAGAPIIQGVPYPTLSLTPSELVIPENLGTIEEVYEGKGGQLVVYIQDAHTNYSAQRNIASIINQLIAEHEISLVGEEGAEGKIDPTLLRAFPIKEARDNVMDMSLRASEINGPEFLAITGEEAFNLVGVDNRKLFLENISQFLEVLDIRDIGTQFVRSTRTAMKNLQDTVYSKAHKELNDLLSRHQNEQIDLAAFLGSLRETADTHGVDITSYRHLTGVLELVHKQQDKQAKAEDDKVKSAMKEIDAERLFLDIENLTYALKAHLAESPLERKLIELEEYLLLLEHGFNLELSRKDAKRLEALHKTFSHKRIRQFLAENSEVYRLKLSLSSSFEVPVDAYYEQIKSFYHTAAKRDGALANRLEKEMHVVNRNTAILVAGGFHKEGITKKLRRQGISYAVVLPHISEITSHEAYLKIMNAQRDLLNLPERNTVAPGSNLDIGFRNRYAAFVTEKTAAMVEFSGRLLPVLGADGELLMPKGENIITLPRSGLFGTDRDGRRTVERWNRRFPHTRNYSPAKLRSGLVSAAKGTLPHMPEDVRSIESVEAGFGAKVRLGQLSAAIPWLGSQQGLFPQLLALDFSRDSHIQEPLALIDALRNQLFSELHGKIHDDNITLIDKKLAQLVSALKNIDYNSDFPFRVQNEVGARDRHLRGLLQLKVRLPAGFGSAVDRAITELQTMFTNPETPSRTQIRDLVIALTYDQLQQLQERIPAQIANEDSRGTILSVIREEIDSIESDTTGFGAARLTHDDVEGLLGRPLPYHYPGGEFGLQGKYRDTSFNLNDANGQLTVIITLHEGDPLWGSPETLTGDIGAFSRLLRNRFPQYVQPPKLSHEVTYSTHMRPQYKGGGFENIIKFTAVFSPTAGFGAGQANPTISAHDPSIGQTLADYYHKLAMQGKPIGVTPDVIFAQVKQLTREARKQIDLTAIVPNFRSILEKTLATGRLGEENRKIVETVLTLLNANAISEAERKSVEQGWYDLAQHKSIVQRQESIARGILEQSGLIERLAIPNLDYYVHVRSYHEEHALLAPFFRAFLVLSAIVYKKDDRTQIEQGLELYRAIKESGALESLRLVNDYIAGIGKVEDVLPTTIIDQDVWDVDRVIAMIEVPTAGADRAYKWGQDAAGKRTGLRIVPQTVDVINQRIQSELEKGRAASVDIPLEVLSKLSPEQIKEVGGSSAEILFSTLGVIYNETSTYSALARQIMIANVITAYADQNEETLLFRKLPMVTRGGPVGPQTRYNGIYILPLAKTYAELASYISAETVHFERIVTLGGAQKPYELEQLAKLSKLIEKLRQISSAYTGTNATEQMVRVDEESGRTIFDWISSKKLGDKLPVIGEIAFEKQSPLDPGIFTYVANGTPAFLTWQAIDGTTVHGGFRYGYEIRTPKVISSGDWRDMIKSGATLATRRFPDVEPTAPSPTSRIQMDYKRVMTRDEIDRRIDEIPRSSRPGIGFRDPSADGSLTIALETLGKEITATNVTAFSVDAGHLYLAHLDSKRGMQPSFVRISTEAIANAQSAAELIRRLAPIDEANLPQQVKREFGIAGFGALSAQKAAQGIQAEYFSIREGLRTALATVGRVARPDLGFADTNAVNVSEPAVSIPTDLAETGRERMVRVAREARDEAVEAEIVTALEDVVANAAQKSQEQIDTLPTRVFRGIEDLAEFKASLAQLDVESQAKMVNPVGTVMFLNEVSEELEDTAKLEITEVFPNAKEVYVRGVEKHLPSLNGRQAALLGELLDEETERFLLFVDRRTLDAMQANGHAVTEAIHLRILAERVTSIAA